MQSGRPITALAEVLREDGRRQDWLAAKLGVYPEQVSRWVRGVHTPTDETKAAIAEALGRPVPDLFPEGHGAEVSSLPAPAHAPVGDDLQDAA